MSEQSFLEEITTNPTTAMDEVMAYVNSWVLLKGRIDDLQEQLDTLTNQEKEMSEKTIPNFLLQNGLDGMDLAGGRKLTVNEDLSMRLPENEEGRKIVLKFLMDKGAGSIIKDTLVIEDAPLLIEETLQAHGVPYDHKQDVNTNSLKAWARGVTGLKKGSVQTIAPTEFPKEAGLYIYRKAKIK